jgi:toxin-antitoxin system PIN domain toxin
MNGPKVPLLDVNVLVALFDPLHRQHDAAHAWFESNHANGWATCAIAENGFVRVATNAAYPNRLASAEDARGLLRRFTALAGHEFWKETVTLRDTRQFGDLTGLSAAAVTDVYLLGLAVSRGGKLATFDRKIPAHFVSGGENALEILRATN